MQQTKPEIGWLYIAKVTFVHINSGGHGQVSPLSGDPGIQAAAMHLLHHGTTGQPCLLLSGRESSLASV